MASKITPELAARQIIKTLKSAGRADRAEKSRVYFKDHEDVHFFGLTTPEARAVEREFFAAVKGIWTIEDALELCDLLIRKQELEAKQLGIELLGRYKKHFPASLIETIRGWLLDNHSANWATTDEMCSAVITPLVQQHPELIQHLKLWTRDKNLWLRRASAVAMVGLARRGHHLDDAYEIAEKLFIYPEDLIHKATGWLLREAGKTDEKRLESFLTESGSSIPRTSLRYAIEKFPPEKRKHLLATTRSSGNITREKQR